MGLSAPSIMSPVLLVLFAASAASAQPAPAGPAARSRPALAQLRALAGGGGGGAPPPPAPPPAPPAGGGGGAAGGHRPAAPAPPSGPAVWEGYAKGLESKAGALDAGRNSIDFLVDAAASDALERAAEGASGSIHVEVFQWQADADGWTFARTLAAKASAGARVRALIDEYGTDTDEPEAVKLLAFLRAGGVDVLVRRAPPLDGHLDHRKLVVIDGATAFVGGMNIGETGWHDQLSEIRGPAVAELQRTFLAQWRAAGGAAFPEEGLFPPPAAGSGGCETLVIAHEGGGRDSRIKTAYLDAFAGARRLVRVADPYLVDADVVAGLEAAARRGVKVQVITPRNNDEKIVQGASRAYYPDMIAAGVEIYEYLPRMAHEKVALVDDEWVTFGSSNLDARSLADNDELNIVAFGAELAADVESRLFEPDLKSSERVERYSPSLSQDAERSVSWLLSVQPANP